MNILISDVNDENPVFHNTPYSFRVKEGEMGSAVGKIKAVDGDSDENAAVTYSVMMVNSISFFCNIQMY